MALGYKLKHYIFNAFREFLIYHHSSLEFRAKVFAVVIAANEHANDADFALVKKAGMDIYDNEDRANTLTLTTKEYVEKLQSRNGLDIDMLAQDIIDDLKLIPRYAKKIDVSQLEPRIECSTDEDTSSYQIRIIEFLNGLKKDYEGKEA